MELQTITKQAFEAKELKKGLDDKGRKTGYNEKRLITILRSAIRKEWMKDKTKLAILNSRLEPDYDPDTRRLWKIQCDCCKNWFKKDEVEVDHYHGEHSFTQITQVDQFADSILDVSFGDLQIMCKPCHSIKTHAERYELSMEEAKFDKAAK